MVETPTRRTDLSCKGPHHPRRGVRFTISQRPTLRLVDLPSSLARPNQKLGKRNDAKRAPPSTEGDSVELPCSPRLVKCVATSTANGAYNFGHLRRSLIFTPRVSKYGGGHRRCRYRVRRCPVAMTSSDIANGGGLTMPPRRGNGLSRANQGCFVSFGTIFHFVDAASQAL